MKYVYIVISELFNDVNRALRDGFIIQGVYSDYETAEKEMLTHFEYLRDSSIDARESYITTGLVCSKGPTKAAKIYWNNGKMTKFAIQERILDQITYASSVQEGA